MARKNIYRCVRYFSAYAETLNVYSRSEGVTYAWHVLRLMNEEEPGGQWWENWAADREGSGGCSEGDRGHLVVRLGNWQKRK